METEIKKSNAEELKAFKAKFTKDKVIEFFTSVKDAINFFEIQLKKVRDQQKEITKLVTRGTLFDVKVVKISSENKGVKDTIWTLPNILTIEFDAQVELLNAKIEHLKTIK